MRHPVDYAPSQDFGDNPTRNLPASHWIIQTFGNYQPDGHTGVDYPCPVGTPVKAAADGVVRHVGRFGGGYSDNPWWIMPSFAGYTYVVDHGHFIGIYGHCQDGGAKVRVGQQVTEGQVLGPSGNTGASTGPHLHFEVLPDGYILNSLHYGRIDPNSLFVGSLTPAGTIKPIQTSTPAVTDPMEEIMGYYRDRADFEGHQLRIAKEAVAAYVAANAKAVWSTPVLRGGKKVSALQDMADGTTAAVGSAPAVAQILENTSTDDVIAQIPDDIAQQVIDALAARLGGK